MRTSKRLAIAVGAWFGLGMVLGLPPGSDSFATGPVYQTSDNRKSLARRIFRMTEPVVCRSIEGYEDYEPLPGAALTADEKLLIYYRPLNYRSNLEKGMYQAHLVQDGEIRKRGTKTPVRQKSKVVDYITPKSERPPELIYLKNTVSLKGLAPGEYDFIIILRDEVAKGAPARQVVKFRVIPADDPQNPDAGKTANDPPNAERTKKASPKPKSKKATQARSDADPASRSLGAPQD